MKMNWVQIVKAVFELFPVIIAAIKAIELLFPESNKGAEKLALVRDVIIDIDADAKENWPLIEKIIGKVVSFCNAMGIFKTTKEVTE